MYTSKLACGVDKIICFPINQVAFPSYTSMLHLRTSSLLKLRVALLYGQYFICFAASKLAIAYTRDAHNGDLCQVVQYYGYVHTRWWHVN